MTVVAAAIGRSRPRLGPWLEVALVLAALGAISIVRLAATRLGLDALGIGVAFGVALLATVTAAGGRLHLEGWRPASILIGVVAGVALVGAGLGGTALGGWNLVPGLGRQAAPYVPWAVVTIVVAVAEEALLRGLLFDRLRGALFGMSGALLVTSVAFALIHVPMYGWHVMPLDLAVGLALGGLRIVTGGIAAPAIAHAVADLATWWL